MRKALSALLAGTLCLGLLASCGESKPAQTDANGKKTVDVLRVGFVPSRQPDKIVTATEPLKNLLIQELDKHGYKVGKVDISVGTTYEAVGEGLSAGTIDIGLIPGGTYVLYEDGSDVLLTATRKGLNNDSEEAKDWNANKPTAPVEEQVKFYRSLIIAGPSEKGRALAKKVNAGEKLTLEDLNNCNWSVSGSTSSAGYIYPSLWLQDHYGKLVSDLAHVVQSDSYGSSFARLASGQVDVICIYADARRDFGDRWTSDYGRKASIWDETDVIGVTPGIYNDTISCSKKSPIMTDEFKKAVQDSFIAISKTDAGRECIKIYNHEGYSPANASDYDGARKAQKLLSGIKKNK